jgi:hypothetical protein
VCRRTRIGITECLFNAEYSLGVDVIPLSLNVSGKLPGINKSVWTRLRHWRRVQDPVHAYQDFTQAAVLNFARRRHFQALVGDRGHETAPAVSVAEM